MKINGLGVTQDADFQSVASGGDSPESKQANLLRSTEYYSDSGEATTQSLGIPLQLPG